MALQPSRSSRARPIARRIPNRPSGAFVRASIGYQRECWGRAGLPVVASPDDPPDAERIDYIFWNYDRHTGNEDAMRAYLQWETELPTQIAAEGLSGFRVVAR